MFYIMLIYNKNHHLPGRVFTKEVPFEMTLIEKRGTGN